ncbi:MAG: single-stranded DNA-binding protein [Chloroflexi bacterium]|nr:single-stranded DNA-binding protein [Chloroflexota bacterium]
MRAVRGTLNNVELIGWLGGAPELRKVGKESQVCAFNVATKRIAGRGESGVQYETEWITVEAWNRLAEQCQEKLHTGSRVMVRGSLMTQSWEDKQSGARRYRTVVRANECLFIATGDHAESDTEHDHEDDVAQ